MPREQISNNNILQWTAKCVTDLSRRGYRIDNIKHGEVEAFQEYRITVWYSGNILQRAWRKLTQW